ncbi:hypothetical protein ACFXB3_02265 [Streptomyces sp. NPDC059447]|uniref:hypothetical protein n=1 Tax=Streptomyces sp. NPDC059447 TaxID=3346834 RepID=UPI0036C6F5E6
MDRVLEALGAAHEGSVGVLLADGTEPGLVYFDVGSGAHMPSSSEWHCYDGRYGRPRGRSFAGQLFVRLARCGRVSQRVLNGDKFWVEVP